MRYFYISLFVAALFIPGCGGGQKTKGVEVVVNEGGRIPSFLEGRWRDKQTGWEFVFDKKGSLTEAVIPQGEVRIIPGKTTTIPMAKGGKGIFKPGKWFVTYTPSEKELIIDIQMEHIRAEMLPSVLEGKSRDIITFYLSENKTELVGEWLSIPDYIAYTPEPHPMKADPEDTVTKVVMEKVKK